MFIPDVDETSRESESLEDLVCRLSLTKALAAADQCGTPLIIAADTLVAFGGDVLGKPRDPDDATAMLQRLRGRSHFVYSGLTVLAPDRALMTNEAVRTAVCMRYYSDQDIAGYVASGDPLDKAGAYAIQHGGFDPVERVDVCYLNVMGLPLCHVYRALAALRATPPVRPSDVCPQRVSRGCSAYGEILTAAPAVLPIEAAARGTSAGVSL